eukprot:scaffold9374_cov83-Cylindrotheca_fusiformis.AAC.1
MDQFSISSNWDSSTPGSSTYLDSSVRSGRPPSKSTQSTRHGPQQRRGREGGGAPEAMHEVEQQPELILLASSKQ